MTTPRIAARATIALQAEAADAGRRAWVHLLPAGTFTGIDGRGPYVVRDPEAIVQASRRYAGRRQMVVDYDHATDLIHAKPQVSGDPIPAAGWIVGMQARADGVWGLVEWTERAAALLARREYRYLSPVFRCTRAGDVGAILRASLTHTPNLDQLTALASAEEDTMDDTTRADILALLGLDPEADDTALVAAIRALVEKPPAEAQAARPDPAKYVPIGDFQRAVAEANKLRRGITLQAAQERVGEDIRKARILPWMKDWAVELCTANLPAYKSFLAGVGPGFSHLLGRMVKGQPPELQAEGGSSDDAVRDVARRLGLAEADITAALRG